MAGIFGGQAGPVGSNISDYTSLHNAPGMSGMGPVADGQQYGQFLQSQQSNPLQNIASQAQDFSDTYKSIAGGLMPQQQMQFNKLTPTQPQIRLQQQDLLSGVRGMGGNK